MNRAGVIVSWIVILAACAGTIAGNVVLGERQADSDDTSELILLRIQAEVLITLATFQPDPVRDELNALEERATTPALARAVAAVRAEVDGTRPSPAALDLLARHRDDLAAPDGVALHRAVETAIRQGTDALDPDARERIREEMGWYGELLLVHDAPADDPDRRELLRHARLTTLGFVAALSAGGFAVVAGLVLLVVAAVLRRRRRMPFRMVPPPEYGARYAEAFAVYVGLFFVLQVVPALVADRIGVALAGVLGFVGLVVASALGALWPILRGVPGTRTARDLGLHSGTGAWREVGWGFVGYVAILPVFVLGFLATLLLIRISSALGGDAGTGPVSHPIVPLVAEGGTGIRLMILFLAAGFAPFFEELMFRGALFGHLRTRFGPAASGLLMALLFAAIHPQGLLTVPALGALAFGFAWLREWRGSLIAPMVAHAVHNGTLVGLMWLALG